ncbi:hypothetical protein [Enterococcus diestrammenae]|uniref:hypothetical protein n=1 Tax=Enterococcus diestrammenae TaxID=1155073 RepID=UPI0022E04A67|nr:hypothetical protein [Enterococcus diestrammenae]
MDFKTGELYEIYTDYNEDAFFVCYVLAKHGSWLVIEKIDRNGEFDGFTLLHSESIVKVYTQTGYLKKYYGTPCLELPDLLKIHNGESFLSILTGFLHHEQLVAIYTGNGETILGKILQLHDRDDEKIVEIQVYSEDSSDFDGRSFLDFEVIQEVSVETSFLRFLMKQLSKGESS